MGIGQKVKEVAHKMGVGNSEEEQLQPGYGNTGYGTTNTGYGTTNTGYATGTGDYGTAQQTNTTTAGVGAPMAAGEGAVLGTETYTRTEDRPVVKERTEWVQEHRPVEQEFVVETRAAGERQVGGGEVENLGSTERVVSEGARKYSE